MLQRCLADISGPFYDLDKPFRNWSSLPFYQLDLPHATYIDERQLALGVARACAQLTQLHAQGYTGIVIDNLAHLATFATAPSRSTPLIARLRSGPCATARRLRRCSLRPRSTAWTSLYPPICNGARRPSAPMLAQ